MLGLPVFVIAMADMIPGNPLHHYAGPLNWLQLVLATAGGLLVRLAVFRAGLGFVSQCQPEYVHADRAGGRLGVPLQPGRDSRPGCVSRRVFASTAAR